MTFAISAAEAFTDPNLFGRHFQGDSWRPWLSFLKVFGGEAATLPPDLAQLAANCTERADLSAVQSFSECWTVAGRRSGKTRLAALLAAWAACFVNWRAHLAPGEVACVAIVAADRTQAKVAFRYARALIVETPCLRRMLVAETADRLELSNGAAVEVMTASAVAVRGRTLCCAILDEVSYWPTGDAAQPDVEVLAAIRPCLATLPGSFLLAISTPYARRGELWDAFRKHFGRDGAPTLVWRAVSATMNSSLSADLIANALEADFERGSAEWLGLFRRDVEAFVSPEALQGCTIAGRRELPRAAGTRYVAFCDPSGGSADSFSLAIGHREGERAVLDCIREVKPPFSPENVCQDFANLLKSYDISRVVSDKYGGVWVAEAMAKRSIIVEQSAKAKSELYLELLPAINSCKVELLDHTRLLAQLGSLERRTSRSGRDSVDHPPPGHDDLANSVAGVVGMVLARPVVPIRPQDFIVGTPSVAATMLLHNTWDHWRSEGNGRG